MNQNEKNHNCINEDVKLAQSNGLREPRRSLCSILWGKLSRFKIIFLYLIILIFVFLAAKLAIIVGNPEKVAKYVSILVAIMVCSGTLAFPFVYVLKTTKYLKGVFYFWFIGWTSLVFFTMIVPSMLINARPELRETILNYFPEELIVLPMFLGGWINGLFFCGIAYGLRVVFLYFKNKRSPKSSLSGN